MVNVVLPELGEGITEAVVSYWFFKNGDRVARNDDLVELVTDKTAFNLPSPCAGVICEIAHGEGDKVAVGQVLAVINEA